MSDQNNQFGNSNKCLSKAEPPETVELNDFYWVFFKSFDLAEQESILCTIKIFGQNFSGAFYISFSFVSLMEKNVEFYYCHSIGWYILVVCL